MNYTNGISAAFEKLYKRKIDPTSTSDLVFAEGWREALAATSTPVQATGYFHDPQSSKTLQQMFADLHLYEEIAEHYAKCAISPEALRDWVAERMDKPTSAVVQAHSLEEDFQHFLAYSGALDTDAKLRMAYQHGNDRGVYAQREAVQSTHEVAHWAEQYECCMKCLDDAKVPLQDEAGDVYSLWGRITAYAKAATPPPVAGDAARYRWLREQRWESAKLFVVLGSKHQVHLGTDCPILGRLDAKIDAAMAAGGGR